MIRSIAIESVRGIRNATFSLDVIPKKPLFLIAPSGCGKSSLTAAFDALMSKRMELLKEQCHLGDESLPPGLPSRSGKAARISPSLLAVTGDAIAGVFDVHVVTSRLREMAVEHDMGSFIAASASLKINELELIRSILLKVQHVYDVTAMRACFGSSDEAFRNLDKTLESSVQDGAEGDD